MDFTLTPEQQLLSDGLDKFLDARYDLQVSRDAAKVGEGWQPKIWKAFVEDLGVVGACLPEDIGGFGGGHLGRIGVVHEVSLRVRGRWNVLCECGAGSPPSGSSWGI